MINFCLLKKGFIPHFSICLKNTISMKYFLTYYKYHQKQFLLLLALNCSYNKIEKIPLGIAIYGSWTVKITIIYLVYCYCFERKNHIFLFFIFILK
jgi:hypothetical protein